MTYKQIEMAREARLWIKDVIVPTAAFVGTLLFIPETREPIIKTCSNVKESIKSKFKKES